MINMLSNLLGLADDIRCLAKAAISRLLTIFIVFIVLQCGVAYFHSEQFFWGHCALALLGVVVTWRAIWYAGRVVDTVLIAAGIGEARALKFVEVIRRLFAVIPLIGLVFYIIPVGRYPWMIPALLSAMFLYLLSSRGWSWDRIRNISLVVIGLHVVLVFLKPFTDYWKPQIDYIVEKSGEGVYYVTNTKTTERTCKGCAIKNGRLAISNPTWAAKDVEYGQWYISAEKIPQIIKAEGIPSIALYKAKKEKISEGFDEYTIVFVPMDHLKNESSLPGNDGVIAHYAEPFSDSRVWLLAGFFLVVAGITLFSQGGSNGSSHGPHH